MHLLLEREKINGGLGNRARALLSQIKGTPSKSKQHYGIQNSSPNPNKELEKRKEVRKRLALYCGIQIETFLHQQFKTNIRESCCGRGEIYIYFFRLRSALEIDYILLPIIIKRNVKIGRIEKLDKVQKFTFTGRRRDFFKKNSPDDNNVALSDFHFVSI